MPVAERPILSFILMLPSDMVCQESLHLARFGFCACGSPTKVQRLLHSIGHVRAVLRFFFFRGLTSQEVLGHSDTLIDEEAKELADIAEKSATHRQ